MQQAAQRQQSVRIRGNGHSMHGLANPANQEWLLSMQGCNHFRFQKPGTITVGAGAAVWDVHQMLSTYGYGLKVYNDGGAAASSLGGYLSAGGFGEPSAHHGGFWETVTAVTLVDGRGKTHRLEPSHTEFRWLFGSLGQLGVAYELDLDIQPLSDQDYPLGTEGTVQVSEQAWEPVLWFTLFVPQTEWQQARQKLMQIGSDHRVAWKGRWPYAYAIRFKHFNPPLLTPHQGNLAAIGIWGDCHEDGFNWQAVSEIQADIHSLLQDHPHWRRYLQTEYLPDDFNYQEYFGPEIWEQWHQLKDRFDPSGILTSGVFSKR